VVGGLRGAARAASLPTDPEEVFNTAISFYQDGYAIASMGEHVGARLVRILSSAAIAIALGVRVGLFMGLSRWAKGVFDRPIEFYWPLPPLAYLPLMIIWLGIGEASKIARLSMEMFAPIAIAAQAGVPEILTGIRIAIRVGWSTLVAAELIAAPPGLGHFVMSASQFLATDHAFVGIGVIALCAFAFSVDMRLMERCLLPWKGQT
jgi:taurine transport system permease protein